MPSDHPPRPTDRLATAVLAVLAGTPADQAARRAALDVHEVEDAAATYHAAGRAALEQQAERAWYQVNVQFPNWDLAETMAVTQIAPRLDQLQADGLTAGWWFLRKHPCWRIRLCRTSAVEPAAAIRPVLDRLVAVRAISCWRSVIYEPEIAAFGGMDAMDTVHNLFCADSRGVLDHLGRPEPRLGRRTVSLLLCDSLLRAAGLDTSERNEVFDRITRLRPTPADKDTPRLRQLTDDVRALLLHPTGPNGPLFAPGGPIEYAAAWQAAFDTTGCRLGTENAAGTLARGLRAILAHIVIFHWNRLGLSAYAQGLLAQAMRQAQAIALDPQLPTRPQL